MDRSFLIGLFLDSVQWFVTTVIPRAIVILGVAYIVRKGKL